jgi:hypothetical protein
MKLNGATFWTKIINDPINKPNERHKKNPSNLGRPRRALENENITRDKWRIAIIKKKIK